MNLKKIGKLLTSKSVRTGPSSYEKRTYRAAVSQRLRNTALVDYLSDYWLLKKPSPPWFIMSEAVASRGRPLDHPVTKLRSIKQQVPCTSPTGYTKDPAVVKMQNSSKFLTFILR